MARRREQRTRTVTENVIVEVKCDLCGKTVQDGGYDGGTNWSKRAHDVDEVTISRKLGSSYPEGGDHVLTFFDICGACFESRVVPAIRALGAEPITEEVSW